MDKKAKRHLAKDPQLKKLMTSVELPQDTSEASQDLYAGLIRSIVFQQLSGKAASTIHQRFLNLFKAQYPNPKKLRSLDIDTLRAAGLSRQKAGYVQNVAEFFQKNRLIKKDWSQLSDDEIIEQLIQIKGVGKWTVQMILMFNLKRPDVFPIDDLVIRQSIIHLYQVKETGKFLKPRLLEIAENWRPYRSTASRYLWRWKDQN